MKTFLSYITSIIVLLYNPVVLATGGNGSTLTAVTGTLQNLKQIITAGKRYVETEFEKYQSNNPSTKNTVPITNLIGGGTVVRGLNNPYVQIFMMLPNYMIVMKTSSDSQSGNTVNIQGNIYSITNPVAQDLLGVEFVFTPIYNLGDSKITSWACFTNADYYKSEYMQQNTTPIYSRSYIAAAAEQAGVVDLSQCIYMGPTLNGYILPYKVYGFD